MKQENLNGWAAASALDGPVSSRRRFLRSFVLGTAASAFLGETQMATVLAACQPVSAGDGILRVKIADWPALQAQSGSLRLAFNPFTLDGPSGAFYPVLINRGANNAFYTLSTQCQHQACVVPTYSAATKSITCLCHGSRYGIDGSLLGGPSLKPLIAYKNSFDGTTLCVEIPGLGFSVTNLTVQSAMGPRFQLSFPTKSKVPYQVVFRQTTEDPGTIIPFASSISGGATTSSFTGTGSVAKIFVDRMNDAGFYSIAVKVTSG